MEQIGIFFGTNEGAARHVASAIAAAFGGELSAGFGAGFGGGFGGGAAGAAGAGSKKFGAGGGELGAGASEIVNANHIPRGAFNIPRGAFDVRVFDVARAQAADLRAFSRLVLIAPTYGAGGLQLGWEAFAEGLCAGDFAGKAVALVSLGDQVLFANSFAGGGARLRELVGAGGAGAGFGAGADGAANAKFCANFDGAKGANSNLTSAGREISTRFLPKIARNDGANGAGFGAKNGAKSGANSRANSNLTDAASASFTAKNSTNSRADFAATITRPVRLVGATSTAGYHFAASEFVGADGNFGGLVLDVKNQPRLTRPRIAAWVAQVAREFGLI